MKKLIAIVAFCVLGSSNLVMAQKVGHVNLDTLVMALPEMKTVEDSLNREAKRKQDDIGRMEQKLQKLQAEFAEKKRLKQFATIEAEEFDYNEIVDYNTRLQQFKEYAQQSLGDLQNTLVDPILKKVKAAITKTAKANGVSYVLDINQLVVILDGALDLTPLVRKELGM